MNRKTKIRLLVSITISSCAEIAIVIPLIIYSKDLSITTWSAIGGPVGIITGIVFLYNLWHMPFPKEAYIIKFSMMINPGLGMIFAGIGILLANFPKYEIFSFLCCFLAIISFLIGLVCFYVHLLKGKPAQEETAEDIRGQSPNEK